MTLIQYYVIPLHITFNEGSGTFLSNLNGFIDLFINPQSVLSPAYPVQFAGQSPVQSAYSQASDFKINWD